jgi:hypothetical protein
MLRLRTAKSWRDSSSRAGTVIWIGWPEMMAGAAI